MEAVMYVQTYLYMRIGPPDVVIAMLKDFKRAAASSAYSRQLRDFRITECPRFSCRNRLRAYCQFM